jgi:DNA polymerase-1
MITRHAASPFLQAAGKSAFVDLDNFGGGKNAAIPPLRELFANGLLDKSVHDYKRGTALLAPLGVDLAGVADDTLLAAYVIDPTRSRYDLVDLARDAVGVEGGGPPHDGWKRNRLAGC